MDFKPLLSMSAQELVMLNELTKLAEEAIKASDLITKNFLNSFAPGKTEFLVFQTETFPEYSGKATLNINGIWEYSDNWNIGKTYKVSCSEDGIYKCYRAYYLQEKNLSDLIPVQERDYVFVAEYFKKFIAELEEKE